MRLINVKTRQFEQFFDDAVPPYAILSHTWETGEVSYQDYEAAFYDSTRGTYSSNKAGFEKIDQACQQTWAYDHRYIWIDTCCIDKSSSSELSEAINSMYVWYADAEICFAYLSDCDSVRSDRERSGGLLKTMFSRSKNRWFGRGWTLQELLAPSKVLFFNKDWIALGYRTELFAQISDVTDIRREVLAARHGLDREQISVSERMSWAANRKTSRREDIAYCLLGIFDVNMPLIYGEGRKAFRRLQEEIIKNNDDHSIFVWRHAVEAENNDLLASSPDVFGHTQMFQQPIASMRHAKGHTMGNTGLEITLPIYESVYPGYWLARLAVTNIASESIAKRTARFFLFLWLHDLRCLGRDSAFYVASPGPNRVISETDPPDRMLVATDAKRYVKSIIIARELPHGLPNGTPSGVGYRGPEQGVYSIHVESNTMRLLQTFPMANQLFERNITSLDISTWRFSYGALSVMVYESGPFASYTVVVGQAIRTPDFSGGFAQDVGIFGIKESTGSIEVDCREIARECYRKRDSKGIHKQADWLTRRKTFLTLPSGVKLQASFQVNAHSIEHMLRLKVRAEGQEE